MRILSPVIRRTAEGYTFEEFIYCGCNCGKTRSRFDLNGRECHYIKGHYILSKEERMKIRLSKLGEKNKMWKGDKVGYEALHDWVIKRKPKPEYCEICFKVPPYDLANITGILNRELRNWGWFCRKCHMYYDNIIQRAWITRKKQKKLTNKNLDSFLKSSEIS